MLSFWKKNAGQCAENPWFFFKNPWETLKCLLQTLQYACCLPRSMAITQSNVLVYSALKFDPLLYRIRFFAGLIPGDDSRFAIFVGFIKLYSRLDYLYLYYSVYIQALNWYRFFSDFEMLYLTTIRNYQASLRYQYWCFSATSAKLSQEMAFSKKTVRLWSFFWKSVFSYKNPFCGKRQSFLLVTREIR